MLQYILFAAGFFLLIKGAELLIKGATRIARNYHVSDIVIGLTIVSLGTSLPELIINLFASFKGNAPIAIGNIFGSNVANVLLILGLSAVFNPLPLKKNTIYSEIPFAIIAALLVGFLANAAFSDTESHLIIDRADGVILLFFFMMFMLYIFKIARKEDEPQKGSEILGNNLKKPAFYVLLGMIMLFFGGEWVVTGASKIARDVGLSQDFIGLTVVAIGTSLPELVTSVIAAKKKSVDIAVGNVIGSNIFNLLWVLGISALIKPLPFDVINNIDILVMVFSTAIIILVLGLDRKTRINRLSGLIFVCLYIAYLYYLFVRG
ncbi:MAG: calcium/sodium antiporter [Bacteroidales bacterium]|nr:calcium/sodium antiporter [Bacteroidales bacterium]MCF8387338.1 calcium/sodium antiporter [Bacteroidales bacterium]MCF8398030.1 calcium/sodium antiporter [Bacteroidales bacterium]